MMASNALPTNNLAMNTRASRLGLGIPSHVWPAIFISYAAVLPQELAINLGGAVLFPYRLVMLGCIPWLFNSFLTGKLKAHPVDAITGLVSAWLIISMIVNAPMLKALEFGGSHAIDFGLAYFAGRASLRNTKDFKTYFRALLPLLVGVALVLMIESMLHRHFIRPSIAQLLGQPAPSLHQQSRMGLYRATGPFPHPILGGVFMASLLPLALFATERKLWLCVGLLVACSMIFTVSSTAILCFLFALLLIAVLWLQKASRGPVLLLAIVVSVTFMGLISVAADSDPFTFAIYRFTLDPNSGYWRLLIWEHAGAEALNNPIFGIGLRDWSRPPFMVTSSIDSHFLLWSMQFGFVAGVGCFLVFVWSALSLLWNASQQNKAAAKVSLGLSICLLSIAFSGFSVALWGGLASWSYMLCGAAISIGTPKLVSGRSQADGLANRISDGHN
ncbi:MAG: O-antigen ligase family protein [Erythrobacter sp.]